MLAGTTRWVRCGVAPRRGQRGGWCGVAPEQRTSTEIQKYHPLIQQLIIVKVEYSARIFFNLRGPLGFLGTWGIVFVALESTS